MSDKNSKRSRRNFLLTVGAGGVAGAAALVAKHPGGAATGARAKAGRSGAGYQESAHIRNYYRTAKV